MKNTKQREAMLCVLRQSTEPLSAEDIFAQMKAAFPSLALSTIYRNLERFAASALVEYGIRWPGNSTAITWSAPDAMQK